VEQLGQPIGLLTLANMNKIRGQTGRAQQPPSNDAGRSISLAEIGYRACAAFEEMNMEGVNQLPVVSDGQCRHPEPGGRNQFSTQLAGV